ncbi:hypothetical protein FACS1894116_01450 [Betaproteobacteria bacterium]|nr:hypothetical protein FACS1894116_01450 [Betaproteobacteria bacterium]GHU28464.1 hypothetical protein FACS189497_03990 [Betaproteobacteria bacterium]
MWSDIMAIPVPDWVFYLTILVVSVACILATADIIRKAVKMVIDANKRF